MLDISTAAILKNSAESGGGAEVDSVSRLLANGTVWHRNVAHADGGGLLFSSTPGPSGSDASTAVEPLPGRVVAWSRQVIAANVAGAGGGVFTRLDLPYPVNPAPLPTDGCIVCRVFNNSGFDEATTGVRIAVNPQDGIMKVASGMSFDTFATENPEASVPAILVLDALGQTSRLDNSTSCKLAVHALQDPTASLAPRELVASAGIVSLGSLAVRSNVNVSLQLLAVCSFVSPAGQAVTQTATVQVRIQTCLPGWDLTADRSCRLCLAGSYAPTGLLCQPCPPGGNCEQGVGDGADEVGSSSRSCACCGSHELVQVLIGVTFPSELEGYWLSFARTSVLSSGQCEDLEQIRRSPTTGEAVCHIGQYPTVRSDGSVECHKQSSVDEAVVFACTTGLELYPCPAAEACVGGSVSPHVPERVVATSTWFRRLEDEAHESCREGHTGVMCSRCEVDYVMDRQRMCNPCPASNAWLYVAIIVVVGLFAVMWLFVDDGNPISEEHLVAIKSRCTPRCVRRAPSKKVKTIPPSPTVAAYCRTLVEGIAAQPDKVCVSLLCPTETALFSHTCAQIMMFVSFMQVTAQFSATYNISWPDSLVTSMQTGSALNLDVASLTSIDCLNKPEVGVAHGLCMSCT